MKVNLKTKNEKDDENNICYRFILFIAGEEPKSHITKNVLLSFCKKYFKTSYQVDIVDVFEDYNVAIENQIIAVPTLIKKEPLPEVTIVGLIENEEKLAKILGIDVTIN